MNGTTNGNVTVVDNYIGGKFIAPSTGDYLDVSNPGDFHVIGKVGVSNKGDVDTAVAAAEAAFPAWSGLTVKARAAMVSFVDLYGKVDIVFSCTLQGHAECRRSFHRC
jgi:hypothetical protein